MFLKISRAIVEYPVGRVSAQTSRMTVILFSLLFVIAGLGILSVILIYLSFLVSVSVFGIGIDGDSMTEEELVAAIVEEVESVRDVLELPTRLRDLDPVQKEDAPAITEFILDDPEMVRVPASLDLTIDEIEAVLRRA